MSPFWFPNQPPRSSGQAIQQIHLENGSSGGMHCVLLAGGTTEPSPRGASAWSSKGYSERGSLSWRVGSFWAEGGVVAVCSDSLGGGVVTVSSLAFTKFCTLFSELSPRSGGLSEVSLGGGVSVEVGPSASE